VKVQVTIPDGEFSKAAVQEAAIQRRTVANLRLYSLRILLNKHQYKLLQYDELKRGHVKAHSTEENDLQTSATTTTGKGNDDE